MRGSGRMFFYTTIETSETLLAPFAFWLKPFRLVFIVLSLSSSSYFPFTTFVAEALRPSIAVPAVPSLMNNLALLFLRLPSCHCLILFHSSSNCRLDCSHSLAFVVNVSLICRSKSFNGLSPTASFLHLQIYKK